MAPADYDGDGKADIGVWRESASEKIFYSLNSSDQMLQIVSMAPQAGVPVSSDYDGDGKADYALRNASTGIWIIRKGTL